MVMNSDNTAYLHIGQVIDRAIHLSHGQAAEAVQGAVIHWLAQRAFQGQSFDPDSFVQSRKLHLFSSSLSEQVYRYIQVVTSVIYYYLKVRNNFTPMRIKRLIYVCTI
jgi:hypothetical protein